MLDAAQYVEIAWDAISDATIKNAFNKAELLNLAGGTDEKVMMADLLRSFKALNIPVDESTFDEFVHVDDENSKEFSHEILDNVNDLLERMQTVNDTGTEDSCYVFSCASLPKPPASIFAGRFQRNFSVRYNQFLRHLARRGTTTDPKLQGPHCTCAQTHQLLF